MSNNIIWLRDESRATERRTPLLPKGARRLIDNGYKVFVEQSTRRIISNQAYEDIGCQMVKSGSWAEAPKDAIILGLKELPQMPDILKNTHIYFAHAYKEQCGWQNLIARFTAGGGKLLDIEYMVEKSGKRVVAFGFWAGYMGAALALIHWNDKQLGRKPYLDNGLTPFTDAQILDSTIKKAETPGKNPKVLVIGAGGRCGQGAIEILRTHGAEVTCWGRDKTNHIDREELLTHDILINCAFIEGYIPAFLRPEDLTDGSRLSVIADVSCDPFSTFNPLPLYDDTTTWEKPYVTVKSTKSHKTIDLIAIDNLPSLLPREASAEFSGLLLPHLLTLKNRTFDPIWTSTRKSFDNVVDHLHNDKGGKIPKHAHKTAMR